MKRGMTCILCMILLFGSSCKSRQALEAERPPANPTVGRNTFELLSYQSAGYRFKIIGLGETAPSGFEQPDFNDTTFNTSSLAFGSGGECPLQSHVLTPWQTNSQLLVRRVIGIPSEASGVRIMVSADNDIVGVFFNGRRLAGEISREGCPKRDEFRFDVPDQIIQPGQNLIAFQIRDRGVESFFDARVLAEVSTTPFTGAFVDKLASAIEPLVPLTPIANVTIACIEDPINPRATISFLVEQTGKIGRIEVTGSIATPDSDHREVAYYLDGKFVADSKVTRDAQHLAVEASSTPGFGERPGDADLLALDAVLLQQPVTERVSGCVADALPPILAEDPKAGCRRKCRVANGAALTTVITVGVLTVKTFFGSLADAVGGGLLALYLSNLQADCERCCDLGCDEDLCIGKRSRTTRDPPQCVNQRTRSVVPRIREPGIIE